MPTRRTAFVNKGPGGKGVDPKLLEEAVAERNGALGGLLGSIPALDNRSIDEARRQARVREPRVLQTTELRQAIRGALKSAGGKLSCSKKHCDGSLLELLAWGTTCFASHMVYAVRHALESPYLSRVRRGVDGQRGASVSHAGKTESVKGRAQPRRRSSPAHRVVGEPVTLAESVDLLPRHVWRTQHLLDLERALLVAHEDRAGARPNVDDPALC